MRRERERRRERLSPEKASPVLYNYRLVEGSSIPSISNAGSVGEKQGLVETEKLVCCANSTRLILNEGVSFVCLTEFLLRFYFLSIL